MFAATSAQAAVPGALLAWGSNTPFQGAPARPAGQLCTGGADTATPTAAAAPANANVTAIAAGAQHSLMVISGAVFACGENGFGQLGNGGFANAALPVAAAAPATAGVVAVSGGWSHSLALSTTGTVYAWGNGAYGQLGTGAAGCAVTPLPAGPSCPSSATPTVVAIPGNPVITAIAAGSSFSLALDSTNQVWAWGRNLEGELGNGTVVSTNIPQHVNLPATVIKIAAGANHGLAIVGASSAATSGAVWAWGLNNFGQLGNNPGACAVNCPNFFSSTPVAAVAPANAGVTDIAGGGAHSLTIIGGAVWAWGRDNQGQLGCGGCANTGVPVAAAAPANAGVTHIAAGWQHSLAVIPTSTSTTDGPVWAWGWNRDGELGNAPGGCPPGCASSGVPVAAVAPANANVSLIAGGFAHSLAVQ